MQKIQPIQRYHKSGKSGKPGKMSNFGQNQGRLGKVREKIWKSGKSQENF